MKLSKQQIQQQREAIDALYELVKERSCKRNVKIRLWHTARVVLLLVDLGLKVLNGKKTEAPKAEETPKVEEPKPKRKRTTKKKEEPVVEAPVVEETPEEDDLDDLL